MDLDYCTHCERPTEGGLYCSEYCRLEDGGWEDLDGDSTADQGHEKIVRSRIPSTSSMSSSFSSMSTSRTSSISEAGSSTLTASTNSTESHECQVDSCKCMSKAEFYLPLKVEIDILTLLDSEEFKKANYFNESDEDFLEIDFFQKSKH